VHCTVGIGGLLANLHVTLAHLFEYFLQRGRDQSHGAFIGAHDELAQMFDISSDDVELLVFREDVRFDLFHFRLVGAEEALNALDCFGFRVDDDEEGWMGCSASPKLAERKAPASC